MLEYNSPLEINKLSARIVGCNLRGDREVNDFYATSRPVTEALLKVEKFEGDIWEPCCGEGHISKVLIEHGYNVKSSDLIDRDYGTPHIDFLSEASGCDNIITNPPYKNALDFTEKAVELARGKTALLLKLNFLEGQRRRLFFNKTPPVRVHVFSGRQTLMKNGDDYSGRSGMMALAWFIWEAGNTKSPTVCWL
jgi:hypothetical protein